MKLLIIALLFPSFIYSSSYIVEISSSQTAPKVKDIVEPANFSSWNKNPPLEAFRKYKPSDVSYLLPLRPFGNREHLIKENPNWELSKLYRKIVINYPIPISTTEIEKSLANDGDIDNFHASTEAFIPAIREGVIRKNQSPYYATKQF